jgi:hypothetical protein
MDLTGKKGELIGPLFLFSFIFFISRLRHSLQIRPSSFPLSKQGKHRSAFPLFLGLGFGGLDRRRHLPQAHQNAATAKRRGGHPPVCEKLHRCQKIDRETSPLTRRVVVASHCLRGSRTRHLAGARRGRHCIIFRTGSRDPVDRDFHSREFPTSLPPPRIARSGQFYHSPRSSRNPCENALINDRAITFVKNGPSSCVSSGSV